MGWGMEDYLGKAAHEKQSAKIAIKERRFDDAWRHLSNQKILYLKHAHRERFSAIHTLVIDSSPHEDMANILRLEGRHLEALQHISYTYATNFKAKRPLTTLEKKLSTYHKRADINSTFSAFLNNLKKAQSVDFVSIRDLVK